LKTCNDINECEEPEKHDTKCSNETQECVNTLGGSYCRCKNGFKKEKNEGNTENAKCVDINECEDNNNGCSHTCINVFGDAHCLCPYGYKLEDQEPFKMCIDIDECEEDNGRLKHNYACVGTAIVVVFTLIDINTFCIFSISLVFLFLEPIFTSTV
jgi:hypothetical protein